MSQKDDILACLAKGPATHAQIGAATGIKSGTLQAQLSELKKKGRVICDGVGSRDPWRLPGATPATDSPPDAPSMIPGGPAPTSETRATDADEEMSGAALWDADEPDETPTADVIALALVASAAVLGEDPLMVAEVGCWLRCRFAAVKALAVFYDGCSWEQLGRFVGFAKLTQKAVDSAQNMPWWADFGDPAFEAAVEALERA